MGRCDEEKGDATRYFYRLKLFLSIQIEDNINGFVHLI